MNVGWERAQVLSLIQRAIRAHLPVGLSDDVADDIVQEAAVDIVEALAERGAFKLDWSWRALVAEVEAAQRELLRQKS